MKKYTIITILLLSLVYLLSNAVEISNNDKSTTKQVLTNNDEYTIEHKLNGEIFKVKVPESIVQIYKQNAGIFIVPAKYLFLEPIVLLLLNELTEKVINVFNKVNLSYWAYGNTAVSVNNFGSFAPWNSDSYLAVDVDQWQEKLSEITNLLKQNGITFFLERNLSNKKFVCSVEFEIKAFTDLVHTYEPLLDQENINKLYKKISNTFIKPKLEIIPFSISNTGIKNYIIYLHKFYLEDGGNEAGYENSAIFPLIPKQLNNFSINSMNKPDEILKEYDYFKDFNLWAGICTNCRALKLDDISKHKEFLNIIKEYLTFVFKDKFISSSVFDKISNNQ